MCVRKNQKGITLISMIITIIVIFVILASISYSSRNGFKLKNLENFYADIDSITDSVSVYYVKNSSLPVYYSSYDFDGNSQKYQPFSVPNTKDESKFYLNFKEENRNESYISYGIIDFSKLDSVSLNYKSNIPDFFLNNTTYDKTQLESSIRDGIYVVNLHTHKVYYTKAITVDGKNYYTKGTTGEDIPSFSKIEDSTAEQDEIAKNQKDETYKDGITLKFFANGGVNAPEDVHLTEDNIKSTPALSILLNNINDIKLNIPSKTGMRFVGWGLTEDSVYFTMAGNTRDIHLANGSKEIEFPSSEYPNGSTINLYAIWEVDAGNILKYYYADNTGGIRPKLSNNKVSRTSDIPAGTKNYICIDIPSSGYVISWNLDKTKSDQKSVFFDGYSISKNLTSYYSSSYTTTEPGTFKIKDNFTDLSISLETGETVKLMPESENIIYFCKIRNDYKRKDLTGDIINDIEWEAGRNGKFDIPSDLNSYKEIGILDPDNSYRYVNPEQDSTDYYLKKMVLLNSTQYNQGTSSIDYNLYGHELGSIAELTPVNNSKTYYMYPIFGAKNYKVTSENTETKYHESLQEAFDYVSSQANEKFVITVCTNVDLGSSDKTSMADNLYYKQHDPTYNKDVKFDNGPQTPGNFIIDFNSYTIYKTGKFNVSQTIVTLTTNNGKGGLDFSKSNSINFELTVNGRVNLDGGIEIKKNSTSSMFHIGDRGILDIEKAKIENTCSSESNPLIVLDNSYSTLFLGDSSKFPFYDTDISLSNNGYSIDAQNGRVNWNYGILSTSNLKYKLSYTDSTESKINSSEIRKPCLYADDTNPSAPIYKTKLDLRVWSFVDRDSGTNRTYYTHELQTANDLINKKNISMNMQIDLYATSFSILSSYSNATITKNLTIDYKSVPLEVGPVKLYIQSQVTMKNLYATDFDVSGIYVSKNSVSSINPSLTLKNCDITSRSNSSDHIIEVTNGTLNFDDSNTINSILGIKLLESEDEKTVAYISGKIHTTNNSIDNTGGDLYVKPNSSIESKNGYAINNLDHCEISGGTVKSNTNIALYSSNSSNIIYGSTTVSGKTGVRLDGGDLRISAYYNSSISEFSNDDKVTTGPQICGISSSGANDSAIYLNKSAELTIGNSFDNVSDKFPAIKSLKYGIRVNGKTCKVKFYDGLIFGKSYTIYPKDSAVEIPDGYKKNESNNSSLQIDGIPCTGKKITLGK